MSSSLAARTQVTTASAVQNQVKEGLDFLRKLKELRQKHVHALWADKNGKEDWFQAKVEKIVLTHKPGASKSAGALVSWLDAEGNVDRSSKEDFITLYDLKRRLKLPETQEQEQQHQSGTY
jgi:hypothetical protein